MLPMSPMSPISQGEGELSTSIASGIGMPYALAHLASSSRFIIQILAFWPLDREGFVSRIFFRTCPIRLEVICSELISPSDSSESRLQISVISEVENCHSEPTLGLATLATLVALATAYCKIALIVRPVRSDDSKSGRS